jgi:hypothetical protein
VSVERDIWGPPGPATAPLAAGQPCLPFFHVEQDDFLSPAEYAALRRSFPGADRLPETITGNKQLLGTRTAEAEFERFCREHPAWSRLFARLSSESFLAELYERVRPALIASRGRIGARRWRLGDVAIGGGSPLGRQRVRMHFEFSRLTRGSCIPPHTDASDKLVSCMLYFPDPDWRPEWGGGTSYYRPRDASFARNWGNRPAPFEALEPVVSLPFSPRRLVAFVKSSESWHGLPPLACDEGVVRNSLNFHVHRILDKLPRKLVRWRERARDQRERAQLERGAATGTAAAG